MDVADRLTTRLGLSVPHEWWPTAAMVDEIEAAGFGWIQLPCPSEAVLADPRSCIRHARAVADALDSAHVRRVLHAPTGLLVGERSADRVLDGAVSYAAECGAEAVVYHARAVENRPAAEDRLLAETRSLAALAPTAERLGITIALENLAPVFPGPETVSANPLAVRALARRIGSPAIGLCLDIGHANVIAGLRRTSLTRMVEPVLDLVVLFHLHDNLGARWRPGDQRPDLDPLRLDLHLPLGEGTVEWAEVNESLLSHDAPLLLEIHPPRPDPIELMAGARAVLGRRAVPRPPSPRPALA